MRPHLLRVTAFGAFAGTEELRFDELEGLFLLHGETGAGKTTLLDAIAFALYGRVPGERGKAKRLRSDHAADSLRTQVQLEATIGGRRLRITRKPERVRPKRSGNGVTKEHASVLLEEKGLSGEWQVKSTRIGEADAEILDLMGMSADQFFQVVLLPQGQFAQFLHSGAEARAELLQKLFGTDRFRNVESWLAERRRETAAAVAAASADVDRLLARVSQVAGVPLPDDTCPAPDAAHPEAAAPDRDTVRAAWQLTWIANLIQAAGATVEQSTALVARRRSVLDDALTSKNEAERLADRQRRRAGALRRQTELETVAPAIAELRAELEAAARAAEVAPVLDAADRAEQSLQAARIAEQRARAAIPAGQDAAIAAKQDSASCAERGMTATAAELRAAGEAQQTQLGRLDALRAVATQAAQEEQSARDARQRADSLEAVVADAVSVVAEHRREREATVSTRDAASRAADALPSAQASADAARRVAADSAALIAERADWELLREAHLAKRETALSLREEANKLREARIDGMRAELAATLVDAAPCPVCGSLDHPDPVEPTFEPVSREREQEAVTAAEQAADAADGAGQRVAAADAKITDLITRLAGGGFTAPGSPAELASAAREAAADAERRGAHVAELKATAATLAGLQRRIDELDELITDAERRQAESAEQRTAALAEADSAAARAARARGTLRSQLGDAPDLETAISATRRLADALDAAADAADQAARAETAADDARERAIHAARDARFEEPGDARAASRQPDWRKDAADQIRKHEADIEATAQLLADPELGVPLDPPAPVAARTAEADAAGREHNNAVEAHGKAEHTAGQLRMLQPRLKDALDALEPLRERGGQARQLADLAAGLGANQYKMTLSSFVLAARLEEVAAAASQRLLTMTAGRYSLVHTDARKGGGRAGLGLLACDSWTGQDRDTSTLSGGETFLASLALALGLADVVTAESAGTPMEALFVDEGFGTLDEDTLEEVMTVLDGLREGGRIVGIVSHVSELRQRIPAQVHVKKGHHGSHVSVTAG
jgi:exonuclease SbcC